MIEQLILLAYLYTNSSLLVGLNNLSVNGSLVVEESITILTSYNYVNGSLIVDDRTA